MNSPAFQFYADDFVAGTVEMSQAEVGAYVRLLSHQWSRGFIPDDQEKLCRIAGGSITPDVMAKFPEGEGGLRRNRRLEMERQKQDAYRTKQRSNAINGWTQRRLPLSGGDATASPSHMPEGSQPDATASPNHMPNACSPSPSPLGDPPQAREEQDATASPNHMPNACQSDAVELPPRFPKTEAEAVVAADRIGCTREFAATEWRTAVARGGRDAKDVVIRSWIHYLSARRDYATSRANEKTARGAACPDVRNLPAAIRALEAELESHPGNPRCNSGSIDRRKAAEPEFEAKTRRLAALRRQVSGSP